MAHWDRADSWTVLFVKTCAFASMTGQGVEKKALYTPSHQDVLITPALKMQVVSSAQSSLLASSPADKLPGLD